MKPKVKTPTKETNATKQQTEGVLDDAICSSMSSDLARGIDDLISKAVTAAIGGGWTIADLRGRIRSIRYAGQPQELLTLDGEPILELWPVELKSSHEDGRFLMTATRRCRTFNKTNVDVDASPPLTPQNHAQR